MSSKREWTVAEKAAKVLGIEFDQIDMLNREDEDAQ